MAKKMGRPQIQIDKKDVESLLSIQCTLEEVQAFLDMKLGGCSEDTIERWCKRTYGKTFAEVSKEKRAVGRISIRRAQFRLAEKSVPMNIWLSKQFLGQKENPDEEERELKLAVLKAKADLLGTGDDTGCNVVIINDTIETDDETDNDSPS